MRQSVWPYTWLSAYFGGLHDAMRYPLRRSNDHCTLHISSLACLVLVPPNLCGSYTHKYPDAVEALILYDPWGFPLPPGPPVRPSGRIRRWFDGFMSMVVEPEAERARA
jgi:hypothetical protein